MVTDSPRHPIRSTISVVVVLIAMAAATLVPASPASAAPAPTACVSIGYNANGGSGTGPSSTTCVVASNTYTAPASSYFTGWNTAARGTGTSYSPGQTVTTVVQGNGAETLYAQWATQAAPAAPTSLVATPGNTTASIAFTAGGTGGAAITN